MFKPPKEPCIRWGLRAENPFAATRGRESAMWTFTNLLWTLIVNGSSVIDIFVIGILNF